MILTYENTLSMELMLWVFHFYPINFQKYYSTIFLNNFWIILSENFQNTPFDIMYFGKRFLERNIIFFLKFKIKFLECI